MDVEHAALFITVHRRSQTSSGWRKRIVDDPASGDVVPMRGIFEVTPARV